MYSEHIYAHSGVMPPHAAEVYASTRAGVAARVAASAAPPPTGELQEFIETASVEELQATLRNFESLGAVIRRDIGDREPNAREARRLEEAQDAIALIEAKLSEPTGRKTKPDPLPADRADGGSYPSAGLGPKGGTIPRNCTDPYRYVFGNQSAQGSRFSGSPGEFFAACLDPRHTFNATGTTGVGTDGGFAVPTVLHRDLMTELMQASELWRLCRLYPVEGSSATIALPDVMSQLTALAGIAVDWTAEASAMTGQVLKWREVNLRLASLKAIAEASSELEQDAPNYARDVTAALAGDAAMRLDHALIAGVGGGTPLGYLQADSTIEVTPESGQAADTIVWANVANMWSRLHPVCKRRAVWLVSPDVAPQMLQMVLPSGQMAVLGGSQNDGGAGAPAPTLLGRPIIESTLAPVLGDRGDIALVDFSQVALVMKNGMTVDYTNAAGFMRDVVNWRLRWRVQAVPIWDEVLTPRNGGQTLSWATVLGARS